METEESHGILARYMEQYLAGILARVKGRDKLVKQIAVCNELILSACNSIEIDQVGQGYIDLEGRRLLQVLDPAHANKNQMISRMATFEADTGLALTLDRFVDHHHLTLDDIYKKGSWSRLCVLAGLKEDFHDLDEPVLTKGLRRFCHHNDPGQIAPLLSVLKSHLDPSFLDAMDPGMKQLLTLFCFSIWNSNPPETTLFCNLSRLKTNERLMDEALFHWQSQSTTRDTSPTGQRYIHHEKQGHQILLFVREQKMSNGLACPYYFLGPATYVHHTENRPMSIVWRLKYPMPARLIRTTRRLAVA